jgi:hypothetical protein
MTANVRGTAEQAVPIPVARHPSATVPTRVPLEKRIVLMGHMKAIHVTRLLGKVLGARFEVRRFGSGGAEF